MIDRRHAILGSAFLSAAAIGALMLPRRGPVGRRRIEIDDALPDQIGSRRVARAELLVLPQRDAVTDQFYDDFAARSYRAPDVPPVTLLVAYGRDQTRGLEVHRPENCYPPYGYVLGPSNTVSLMLAGRAVAATALTAVRGDEVQQLLFWTRIGETFPTSAWQGRLSTMSAAMHGVAPDGVLVRLSMPGNDAARAQMTLAGFARTLIEEVKPEARRLLVGAF